MEKIFSRLEPPSSITNYIKGPRTKKERFICIYPKIIAKKLFVSSGLVKQESSNLKRSMDNKNCGVFLVGTCIVVQCNEYQLVPEKQ